jgi:glycosyltransferase involved in cell wall biosynthesis
LPRIAVILPVYNRAKVLPGAVESVLAQDFDDFELIVVDDGSSDGTADVARRFRDSRVRVVEHGANRGSNAARNTGIRFAKAPLLAFLDSDDRYLPHKLSTVVSEFDARPELDVLVDSFIKQNCPGSKRPLAERTNPSLGCTQEFTRRLFCRELWKPTSAITVKREAAIRAGLFDEGVRRRQDLDFLIRLTKVANCAATGASLWVKGWSADGISAGDQFVGSTLEIVRRHPQYLEKPEYRTGLAKDLARHLWQLLGRRCYAQASSDTRLMVRDLGAARTAALMIEGTREIARRARERRLRRRPAVPAKPAARA